MTTKEHPTATQVLYACEERISEHQSWHGLQKFKSADRYRRSIKISTPDGGDRFDGRIEPHNHFLCEECGRLLDLELDMKSIEEVNCLAGKNFDGAITSSSTLFFGKCGDCIKKS